MRPQDTSYLLDWTDIAIELDARGCAVLPRLLAPIGCHSLAALYAEDGPFRNCIVRGRHGLSREEYKAFRYPLPPHVQEIRAALYP